MFDRDWVFAVGEDGLCAFLDRNTKQCRAHDDKPDICKQFGLSEHPLLSCPYLQPDGRRRSRASQRRVFRATRNPTLMAIQEAT